MADTIELIRKRVLDMAIRGELVEQHPEEVIPNVSLLKNKTQDREFISFSQQYKIPENWVWTTLENITNSETLRNGDWILSENMTEKEEVKLIQLGSVGFGKFLEKNYKHISYETFNKLNCTEITTNDLLINRLIGDKMLVTLLPEINGKKITSVDVCIMKPNQEVYDSRYMMYAMMSPLFQMQVMAKSSGTTRKRISKNNLVKLLISFPPLEEQKRIVAKIEEIFAIINQIGTKKEEALSIIRNIRLTALQDAVMGVLVEQEENNEPASVLYKKIQAEKEHLVKEKKIKKEKQLPAIEEDEVPFELPEKWGWIRLGDATNFIDYRGKTPQKTDSGIRLLTAKNVKKGYISLYPEEFIGEDDYDGWMTRGIPNSGDVLFTTEAPLGNVSTVDLDEKFALAQRLICLQPYHGLNSKFLSYALQGGKVRDYILEKATGTTVTGIKAKELKKIPLPLPPLAEQYRIVEKLDEIMAICDQMESILNENSEVNIALKVAE